MAAFSSFVWLSSLTPAQRLALGLPPATPDSKTGPGRKKLHTPAVDSALVQLVEKRKAAIETGAVRFERPREYGDYCGNAKALESLALEQLRRRLIEDEGLDPAEADRCVKAYARKRVFDERVRVLEANLSTLRRRARR